MNHRSHFIFSTNESIDQSQVSNFTQSLKMKSPNIHHVFSYIVDNVNWFEVLCLNNRPLSKNYFNAENGGGKVLKSKGMTIQTKINN